MNLSHLRRSPKSMPKPRPHRMSTIAGGPSRAQAVELLARTPLFRGLTSDQLSELFRAVRHRQIGAGTTFHSPDAETELLYFIKRGRVRLYRLTATGRKIVLTDLKAPAAFGSMALLGQGMDRDFAEAVDESLVCTVRRDELERFLRHRPEVALRMLDVMGRQLWEIERRVEEMAAFTTEQRLATILQRLADPTTGSIEGLTQQELAETSGTVRQTVARILGRWRERGLVAIRRRSVRILRPDALAALATKAGLDS